MHVLGIDAGGTKTVALLADADGRIVGEGRAGAANLQTEGELEVEKILHTVIEQALRTGASRRPPPSASAWPASIARTTRASSATSCGASASAPTR